MGGGLWSLWFTQTTPGCSTAAVVVWRTSQCARRHNHAVSLYIPDPYLSQLMSGSQLPKQIWSHHTSPTWKGTSSVLPPQANNCSSLWLLPFPVPPQTLAWCPGVISSQNCWLCWPLEWHRPSACWTTIFLRWSLDQWCHTPTWMDCTHFQWLI